ncbi:hypothetical protein L1987_41614 [Smallanthus sonchifolius]|uniref:Uncharacterized protein n=1 Tax=Smallanthus sonchifolius TaxID=185202 RepID=A0ACB9GVN2_9ASTR|nr:hypothetical protein L1987_41614 [Smallanthus sonchifolius]
MKLRPLLSIFSSTSDGQSPTPPPSKLLLLSDSSSNISDATTSSLPLREFPTGTLTLSVSHLPITYLKPLPAGLKFLAVHNHLLYAATGNLIHVIDTSSFALLDTFSVARSSSGSIKSVAFSNGNIYTSHQDNKIRVWKLTENKRHKRIATLPTLEDRLLR